MAAGAFAADPSSPGGSAGTSLPNVVILYGEDMGFGDLGANNPDSKIPMPNLDQLPAEGLRFTDGHSSSGILHAEPPEAFDGSKPVSNGSAAHGFDYSFTDCVINFPPSIRRR
jgi:arylsulfatase A-like enzyme